MATTLPFNGVTAGQSATGSVSIYNPGNQAGGSIIAGANSPSGATSYFAPFYRFQPTATLANGNNVVDLVMPGGPNHASTWYVVVYTVAAGVLT